ncbi:MAG: 5-formyltetrahydrofolate cyclo-ligase, partial [Halothece sp. Uz-M2-17]|nr:5-formyltetrahydrofolate cyclo-ligase [Halothece sp. Uz-M2-17]
MVDKKKLRKELLKTRQALSQSEWVAKSSALCEQIRLYLDHAPAITRGGTILSYFHFRQEPNLDPLFQLNDYFWGVPRCVGNELSWHFWEWGDPLVEGTFGIREPVPDAPLCSPDNVDLILVPAVACDPRGYRLGYGGGFYDRLFEQSQWRAIPKLGIVFDDMMISQVPADPWDVPLDGVCTDWGW